MPISGRFDADFQPFLDAVRQATKALEGIDEEAKQLNTSLDRVASGKGWVTRIAEGQLLTDAIHMALDAVKELAAYFPELAMRGAVIDDVESSFEHLATQAGLTGDALIGSLREGVHGTIGDFELMKRANQDMAAGLNLSESQFKLVADGAYALAKATGGDTTTALNAMSDALVTGRTKGIAALVGKLDLKKAEADYAEQLRGTGQELTEEGKLEVDRAAILQRVEERLAGLGKQTDNLDDKVAQISVTWKNFEDKMAVAIARSPVLAKGLDAVHEALVSAFGGSEEALIKNIVSAVNQAAITAVDFGLGLVETARVIHAAWSGIEVLILGVSTLIAGEVDLIIEGWTKVAQAGNAIHLIPDSWVQSITDIRTQTRAWTVDLAQQTAEAAQGVIGNSEFDHTLDKLGGTLFVTRDALVAAAAADKAAGEAKDTHAKAAVKAAEGTEKLGAATVITTQYTKQYVEAWDELNRQGEDYAATVAALDPQLVQQIEYYLKAGASLKTLADAYPQVTSAQIAAIDVLQKRSEKAAQDVEQIWNEYTEIVGSGSASAYDKAGAAVDKWYANDIAKHAASKTDSKEYYEAITALDRAKWDELTRNELEHDRTSKEFLDKQVRDKTAAFEFALAHSGSFSEQEIQHRRNEMEAAQRAADAFGTGFVENAKKATDALEVFDAAINRTASDAAAMEAAQRNSFQFAGAYQIPEKFRDMSTEAKRLAGYIDLYGRVTPQGEAAGLGYSARATGGPVSAFAPYLVGEQGPELFVPSQNGTIVPNGGGGGGTRNVTININGSVLGSPNEIARVVGGAMMNLLRSQGTRLPISAG